MKSIARRAPLAFALIAAVLAVTAGQTEGKDAIEGWQLASRYTARAGLPFLLIAFVASSLAKLAPSALTGFILSQRRWWGLGFAVTHTVHLYCIIKYYELLAQSVPVAAAIVGGGAYVALFVMAATSFDAAQRELGVNWKRLHKVGIYWLWAVFTISYGSKAITGAEPLISIPAVVALLAAFGLRMIVWRQEREAQAAKLRRRSARRRKRNSPKSELQL